MRTRRALVAPVGAALWSAAAGLLWVMVVDVVVVAVPGVTDPGVIAPDEAPLGDALRSNVPFALPVTRVLSALVPRAGAPIVLPPAGIAPPALPPVPRLAVSPLAGVLVLLPAGAGAAPVRPVSTGVRGAGAVAGVLPPGGVLGGWAAAVAAPSVRATAIPNVRRCGVI